MTMEKRNSAPMARTRPAPSSPAALRASLNSLLTNEARRRGVTVEVVRKQYIFAVFFRRVFARENTGWMLLGGNALLIRTGGGRFTRDIDLARESGWESPEELLTELRDLITGGPADGFRFEVTGMLEHDRTDAYGYGTATSKIGVRSFLGAVPFEPFSIDVSVRRHIEGPVDHIAPMRVIDHPSLTALPLIPTVPVENHLADKICAMYEPHESGVSTRYRDLADIVRIIKDLRFDAGRLDELLEHESRRRRIQRPLMMTSPGNRWATEYENAARDFAEFPVELRSLDASLAYTSGCLTDVLARHRRAGTWDPEAQAWT
ncbi:nucleotidyl transferase AbiEii/AbiGii toxin family protein [Brachybacterium sp. ACRRE]|uniref:nucleotidyl transferase AbiEii/AbiGii toxin family protein n=1 Tax=Brachybacterium sp. ACRRE TaxID=2918184 RepID=UPI001EF19DBB|nr:nucleotidyl transferase AbiEii/AbiGii toxin family protein [Brachybacterium sp. ACRRE]MCG7310984.1 nucleotidyl transferase AbiEii/AbiGii toxin family protein [Brachybacterium sp. ACRRE]